MEQIIEGDSKGFNLSYVNWRNPGCNRFHVTVEFSVERARSTETARPDIDFLKQLAEKHKTPKRKLMQEMGAGTWLVRLKIVNQYLEIVND